MARTLLLLVTLLVTSSCASFNLGSWSSATRASLWEDATAALARFDFAGAQALFEELADGYPETVEGRESLLYLGAIHLDPRNADWDPQPALERLSSYLAFQREDGPRLYRYLEAQTLHEIARQLNLPPESRVEGLQPEERVVTQRVVVPAQQSRDLSAEVERLRGQLAEREAQVRAQQEELERIRRTLSAPGRQ